MGFSRQEYWSGLSCPPPADLPDPGIEPGPLISPVLAGGFFITSTTWEAPHKDIIKYKMGGILHGQEVLCARAKTEWSLNNKQELIREREGRVFLLRGTARSKLLNLVGQEQAWMVGRC